MRRLIAIAAACLLVTACGTAAGGERSVFVDYSHDEFASFMIANFPNEVTVAAGDTVVFKQVWTGEPHTVTGGKLVDEMMQEQGDLIPFVTAYEALAPEVGLPNPEAEEPPDDTLADIFEKVEGSKNAEMRTQFLESYDGLVEGGLDMPPRDDPGDTSFADIVGVIDEKFAEIEEGEGALPWALDETDDGEGFVTQNAGQPCYLERGLPPEDADKPCTEEQQVQPAFDGTASYYNSGIIPYEGPQGNTYRVELAEDIEPGSYFFYCAVHGPPQRTEVKVRPAGSEIPSQETVSRRARRQIEVFAEPMLESFRDARDGEIEVEGEAVEGPFAGLTSASHGSINEFVPKTIQTEVGEPVTWKLMGSDHTISFDVPEYFPVIQFADNGKVALNPRLQPPAGGSPEIPEGEEGEILSVDGGTYDGRGFFSSGLFGREPYAEYTLRFSRTGTYKYACLLHPPMVGTVEVT